MPRFPLQTWSVAGFRALRDETTLSLGGLNVLVGANSAGKSSLIQSLLLAGQTLANPLAERALVLNGPLVQLGLADDCVHEESGRHLSLGFELALSDATAFSRALPERDLNVDFRARFEMSRDRTDFVFDTATVTVRDEEEAQPSVTIDFFRQTKDAARRRFREGGLKGQRLDQALATSVIAASARAGYELDPPFIAARMRQFFPEVLYDVENANWNQLQALMRSPWGFRTLRRRAGVHPPAPSSLRAPDLQISADVAIFLVTYLRSLGLTQLETGIKRDTTLGEFTTGLPELALEALGRLEHENWVSEHLGELPTRPVLTRLRLPDPLDAAFEGARRFFGQYVRHLGPLREAPRPLYSLPEAAAGESVGRSGEYTAAVLSAHRNRRVMCPTPNGGQRELPLAEAVNLWLSAMKLLSSVHVEERGKLGYEMQLEIEGVGRPLDLTAVGVGVSQALPVVVLGLISPPGSLVVLEQPELHLHPDVQASMADFFLALAASGRQLLVETHSEYLINRLRRRAAEAAGADVSDLIRIYFVERATSTSTVRSVRVMPNGGIPEWPLGFLDQSAREIEAIVRASHKA